MRTETSDRFFYEKAGGSELMVTLDYDGCALADIRLAISWFGICAKGHRK